jgi:hypothetical protein
MFAALFLAALSLADGQPATLVQQSPHPWRPTPYVTTITATTDGSTIRIRFDCIDPDPSRIAVHTMLHDDAMSGDDTVSIVLDTFSDRRTAYFFSVNAAGARAEGLISDRGGIALDWDGVWDADARRTPMGWIAEMAIPVATLRFPPGATSFGFNAERRVPRDDTVLRLASPTLDSSLFDLDRAGALTGVEQLRRASGASVTTNALARAQRNFEGVGSSSMRGAGGIDAGYQLTPQVNGTVTVHTDFAETEVDTRQINLSRFPLFFPEKRRFFAEGSDQFHFGYGLGSTFIPFYSRRIGLLDGQIVPIEAGAKLLARSGRWSVAALDVHTNQNLFAGRATFDVDPQLRIGGIITQGNPRGGGNRSLEGLDAVWNTSHFLGDKNLVAAGWAAHSGGNGWGATLVYPNDLWNAKLAFNSFGDGLDPALGFLPRPGTRREDVGTDFRPRPAGDHWIRQYGFQLYGTRIATTDGVTQSTEVFATPFGFTARDGARFELNIAPRYERLDEPFAITDRAVIPAGRYHFVETDMQLESPPGKPLSASAILAYGTFYNGHIRQVQTTTGWSHPSGKVQMELDTETDFGSLPAARFTQRLLQLKVVYALSPQWILSSYTQFDSQSHSIGMNDRLRWTLHPNTDLFLVWNRGWKESPLDRQTSFAPSDQQVVAKIRWILQR